MSSNSCQYLCFPRFDLMGLSPDAPEDEAGIKKAAENSKALAPLHPPSTPQEGVGRYICLVPFPGPLQQLSPKPSHAPSPQ